MSRRDIDRLQDEVQELIADLWQLPRFSGLRRCFRPHVDCYRSDDPPALHATVELAGVDPERLHVVVADHVLLIAGVRERPAVDAAVSFQQMEIDYGPFELRLPLAEEVDAEGATASYERGLLQIRLPIAERPRPARAAIVVRRTGA